MDLAIISLTTASQPSHWSWGTQVPFDGPQNISFRFENFLHGVLIIGEVCNLLDRRRVGLLELGGNKEAGQAHELQL